MVMICCDYTTYLLKIQYNQRFSEFRLYGILYGNFSTLLQFLTENYFLLMLCKKLKIPSIIYLYWQYRQQQKRK